MGEELPAVVHEMCSSFTHALNHTADGLLTGFYLRGSLGWGEFFPGSDVDFTAVLAQRPGPSDLRALEAAHTQIWFEFPQHNFDGHHVVLDDLQAPPSQCPPVPCSHNGRFVAAADLDVNPIAWHELATRGIRITGREPGVLSIQDDADELWQYTHENLASYWGRTAKELKVGWMVAGRRDDVVAWCTLGVARLHHLLNTGHATSKSGAGRYILEQLDERWQPLAADALRARERPDEPTGYRHLNQRGKDLRDFVTWVVEDGASLPPVRA